MANDSPQVLLAHDPTRGPLTAVRRMLVHSSISGIQAAGWYDRYTSRISPGALQQINALIGPGWMPVELVSAHYEACDQLGLSDEEIQSQGVRAGEAMGNALLIAHNAHTDVGEDADWNNVLAFSRMGRRIYEGGSTLYAKLSPHALLMEHKGNPLFGIRYYRVAHAAFLRTTFGRVGIDVTEVKLSPYRSADVQIESRLYWK